MRGCSILPAVDFLLIRVLDKTSEEAVQGFRRGGWPRHIRDWPLNRRVAGRARLTRFTSQQWVGAHEAHSAQPTVARYWVPADPHRDDGARERVGAGLRDARRRCGPGCADHRTASHHPLRRGRFGSPLYARRRSATCLSHRQSAPPAWRRRTGRNSAGEGEVHRDPAG